MSYKKNYFHVFFIVLLFNYSLFCSNDYCQFLDNITQEYLSFLAKPKLITMFISKIELETSIKTNNSIFLGLNFEWPINNNNSNQELIKFIQNNTILPNKCIYGSKN